MLSEKMTRNKNYFLVLSLCLLVIPLASAGSFTSNVVSLDKAYSGGEIIRGKINFNFTDYPSHTSLTSSWGDSIYLIDFIRASGVSTLAYNCSTENCSIPYVKNSGISSVDVRNGASLVGLTLSGSDVNSIRDARIKISSGLAPSCVPPLSIVLGDVNNITISPTAYKDVPCAVQQRGCFDNSLNNYLSFVIPSDGNHYCEKISLPPAPAYRLGAGIIQSNSGSANIKMSLLSESGDSLAECLLPDFTQSSQSLDCLVKYSSPLVKDYYVCVEATGSSNYKINAENDEPCGTSSVGSNNFPFDYDIYAVPLQFDSPEIVINDTSLMSLAGIEFSSWIQDYLSVRYKNNCQPYCVVPIALLGQDQTINFANTNLVYDVNGGFGSTSQQIYSISQGDATIKGKNILLDLSKTRFAVPSVGGTNNIRLSLGGSIVVDSPINVTVGFYFSISPQSVPFGVPVTYTVNVANITKTKWNFGDGSGELTSTDATISHSYLQAGMQNVSVEVTTKNNTVSKRVFGVYVGDAKEGANTTISLYEKRLAGLNGNVSSYPVWVQNAISSSINITEVTSKFATIKSSYSSAKNDSDYRKVMSDLLALNVPVRVAQVRREEFPLAASLAGIDTGLAESASGESIPNPEQFRSGLGYWNGKHVSGKITLKEISAVYDSDVKTLVTIVTVEVNPIGSLEPSFLVFSYSPGDVIFSQSYNQKSVSGGTSIALQDSSIFDFAIADTVTLSKLGAYVMPQEIMPLLDSSNDFVCRVNDKCESELGETADNCPADCNKTTNWKLITYLSIIFILAIITAIVIWTWYKKRFERTLYKNPRDFYNITTFIVAARKMGTKDPDIKKKLKKAGWTFDQIHYAFSKTKHEGK